RRMRSARRLEILDTAQPRWFLQNQVVIPPLSAEWYNVRQLRASYPSPFELAGYGARMHDALKRFASLAQQKFASHVSGEPEDQLRAPFEQLLVDAGKVIGIDVLGIGETLLEGRG